MTMKELNKLLEAHDCNEPLVIKNERFCNMKFKNELFNVVVFEKCTFVDCKFIETSFMSCEFKECEICEVTFKSCVFNSMFDFVYIVRCNFENCFIRYEFKSCKILWCDYRNCKFDKGITLNKCELISCFFKEVDFDFVNLGKCEIHHLRFQDCKYFENIKNYDLQCLQTS